MTLIRAGFKPSAPIMHHTKAMNIGSVLPRANEKCESTYLQNQGSSPGRRIHVLIEVLVVLRPVNVVSES